VTIAVTGPFASGKSTFVRLLGELGAETLSADEVVHDLLSDDEQTVSRVVERFGDEVLGERGVDRRVLGRKVFGDPEALRDLENILHPLVRRETWRRVAASEAELFVTEVPLLFEGGSSADYDYTVAVTIPEERRRAWAAERGVDEATLKGIEARQLSQEQKATLADVVVQNDGGVDKLKRQAEELKARSLGGSVLQQEE
jgi:dephospho-CoA kinase